MKFLKVVLPAFVALFMLSGCETLGLGGSGPSTGIEGVEGGNGENGYGASTSGIDGAEAYTGDPLLNPASLLSTRVIQFAFDSSEVATEFLPVVAAHAEYLAANPGTSVVLEAHADERGSREYNVALSERRGQAVADLLRLQNVAASQIRVMSYGEEQPVNFGHDEQAWSENRRVKISYAGE
jgi:peptidoglycan-associated lipoprotein